MSVRYKHADAREGIRELITEFGKSENHRNSNGVLSFVHSLKWIHLIAAGCEPPGNLLIRPFNRFTIGYTTHVPWNDPAFDNHAEVVRTGDGQLYFLENRYLLAASEFAGKLIRLVGAEAEPTP